VRLLPYNLAAWSLIYSDRLVLLRSWPTSEVGKYAVAYRVAAVVGLLAGSIGTAWGPAVLRVSAAGDTTALFRRGVPAIVATGAMAAAGVALCARPLLLVFAGGSFVDEAGVVPYVAMGMVGLTITTLAQGALLLQRRPGLQSVAAVLGAGTNLWLCLVLVPKHAGVGAGFATATAYALQAIVVVTFAARSPVGFPWRETLVATLLPWLLLVWSLNVEASAEELVVRGAAFVACAVGTAWLLRGSDLASVARAAISDHRVES
jgi:O-antigen/teichoic acid export membrane protein